MSESVSLGATATANRRLAYLATMIRVGTSPEDALNSATAWDAFVAAAPSEGDAEARDALVTARLARGYAYQAFNADLAAGFAVAAAWSSAVSAEPVEPPAPPADSGTGA